ncbi:unnamed protein product [Camellia sinensis]
MASSDGSNNVRVDKESGFLASSHGSSYLYDLGLVLSLPFSGDFSVTICLW